MDKIVKKNIEEKSKHKNLKKKKKKTTIFFSCLFLLWYIEIVHSKNVPGRLTFTPSPLTHHSTVGQCLILKYLITFIKRTESDALIG